MKICRINTLSRVSGKWETWYDYKTPDEAEIAAIGLIQGGAAAECHILEVRSIEAYHKWIEGWLDAERDLKPDHSGFQVDEE